MKCYKKLFTKQKLAAPLAAGLMDSGSSCLVLPSKDASLFYDAVRQVPALGPVGVSIYIYTHIQLHSMYIYIYRLVSSVYYIYMYMIYTTNSANLVRKNRTEVWDILGVSKGIHQIWGLKPETKSLEVQDNMVNRVV